MLIIVITHPKFIYQMNARNLCDGVARSMFLFVLFFFFVAHNLAPLLRHAVGRPAPATSLDLKDTAFDPKEKIWTRFPPEGSKHTPPHQSCEFKWKDYCPLVFRSVVDSSIINVLTEVSPQFLLNLSPFRLTTPFMRRYFLKGALGRIFHFLCFIYCVFMIPLYYICSDEHSSLLSMLCLILYWCADQMW